MLHTLSNIFQTSGTDLVEKIVELVFFVLTLGLINTFVIFFIKRKVVYITNIVASVISILAFIFNLYVMTLATLLVLFAVSLLGMFINSSEIRTIFANKFSQKHNNKGLNKKNTDVEKVIDTEKLYEIIGNTTLYLAKNKIGAIMTFERKDSLDGIIKNGSILNAPVTYELLLTIFYPGTRLHDGAVIIKGDKIVAASVFYTPSTKPLVGKYGSRHRAALGISEICDAVTIVVSEETGRISLAYNGEIETYVPDKFLNAFINIMSEDDVLSNRVDEGNEINE